MNKKILLLGLVILLLSSFVNADDYSDWYTKELTVEGHTFGNLYSNLLCGIGSFSEKIISENDKYFMINYDVLKLQTQTSYNVDWEYSIKTFEDNIFSDSGTYSGAGLNIDISNFTNIPLKSIRLACKSTGGTHNFRTGDYGFGSHLTSAFVTGWNFTSDKPTNVLKILDYDKLLNISVSQDGINFYKLDDDGRIIFENTELDFQILVNNATFSYASNGTELVPIIVYPKNITFKTYDSTINITAKDVYDNSSINTFNVTVQGSKDFDADDGLVAAWHLDGNAYDVTGVNNGTVSGATVTNDGKLNQAYEFDGVNDEINGELNQDLSISNFTYCGWINKKNQNPDYTNQRPLELQTGSVTSAYINWGSDEKINFGIVNISGTTFSTGNSFLIIGLKYHVCLVVNYDEKKLYGYINSQLDGSMSFNGYLREMDNFRFGTSKSVGTFDFNGILDEVRIYNRSLEDWEIKELYAMRADYYTFEYNYSTTNGTYYLDTHDELVNLTIFSDIHYPEYLYNVGGFDTLQENLSQTNITFNIYYQGTSTLINEPIYIEDTTTGIGWSTGNGVLNINPFSNINLDFTFSNSAFYTNETTFNFNVLENGTYNVYLEVAPINITFKDSKTGLGIPNNDITITYPSSYEITLTTDSNGKIQVPYIRNGVYDYGNYTLEFSGVDGYISPMTFTYNVNSTVRPFELEYSIALANIDVNVYDRETGLLLQPNLVYINFLGITNGTTTNGTYNLQNATIIAGDYIIQALSDGYITEQATVTYTTQSNATLDLYLLNATGANTALLYVNVLDDFYRTQTNARVLLYEYDPLLLNYKYVSEVYSNSNGEAVFGIELNAKTYYLAGSKTISGDTYTAETNPEIIRDENEVRNLILRYQEIFQTMSTDKINLVYSELFENNISTIFMSYTTTDNFIAEMCVAYYIDKYVGDELVYYQCVNSSSAYIATPVLLNRDNTYYAIIYQNYYGTKLTFMTFPYESIHSLENIFNYDNMNTPMFAYAWVILIAVSIMLKSIPLFSYVGLILAWIQFYNFPSISIGVASGLKTIMLILLLIISRKKEDST